MNINYSMLATAPRLLMEADLKPLQGGRFQPTGFPDLGPARYKLPDGTEMLLVESAQSVANRMELACWDATAQDLIADLRGLPYVKIVDANKRHLSNSLLEAHRINSEYVMKESRRVIATNGERKVAANTFGDEFAAEIGYEKDGRVDWKRLHEGLLKYDPNSLIHGCFLEEIGGRLRVTRALSGFIEARHVAVAESGGVKNNIVQPELKGGEGNVPFHRTEFVAKELKAYFNLDLALLRGYGLGDEPTNLLIALSLLKIRRFLSTGLRLRTACDLEIDGELTVTRPEGFPAPAEDALLKECKSLIQSISDADRQDKSKDKLFADPAVTEVAATQKAKPAEVKLPQGTQEPTIPEELKEHIEWRKGTTKKSPVLRFKKSLTPGIADKAKELFGGDEEVVRAIDEELRKHQSGSDDNVSRGSAGDVNGD